MKLKNDFLQGLFRRGNAVPSQGETDTSERSVVRQIIGKRLGGVDLRDDDDFFFLGGDSITVGKIVPD